MAFRNANSMHAGRCLASSGRNQPNSGSSPGRTWPKWGREPVEVGRIRPTSWRKIGQNRRWCAQDRPMLGRCSVRLGAEITESDPNARTRPTSPELARNLARNRRSSTKSGPKSSKLGLTSTKYGPISATCARNRPRSAKVCPELAPKLAWGRLKVGPNTAEIAQNRPQSTAVGPDLTKYCPESASTVQIGATRGGGMFMELSGAHMFRAQNTCPDVQRFGKFRLCSYPNWRRPVKVDEVRPVLAMGG